MTRNGFVDSISLGRKFYPLHTQRTLYRVTDRGMHMARQNPTSSVGRTLIAVHNCEPGQPAPLEALLHTHFSGFTTPSTVTYRLRKLVTDGFLEEIPHPASADTIGYVATPKGQRYVNRGRGNRGHSPLPKRRPVRSDQLGHHLLTVQAALQVILMTNGRLHVLLGDEDLRSRVRAGRSFRSGTPDEQIPDGELRFTPKAGGQKRALIEILTSKYSDAVILKKYSALPSGTIFASPSERLSSRVERLTGRRPITLEG